jgi:acyl-CoA thioesterase-1
MLKFRQVIWPVILLLTACHSNNSQANTADTATPMSTNNNTPAAPPADEAGKKTILFCGNSLTAGYGLDPDHSFPARIGHRLDSLHLPYKAINAGVSGETTSDGKSRIGWVLRQPVDIFVLELGANDGLRGIPIETTRANLQAIIDTVLRKYPKCKILLCGMRVPPSMGSTYSIAFHDIYTQLAKKNKLSLIPFLLEGVGGNPSLNQADGIHPNLAGERIVTETVWNALHPLL